MTETEGIIIGLLVAIAAQTTYTTYRTWRVGERTNPYDVFVDTSVLMDGRIVPVAEAGFMPGRLVIPRSVIGELQLLADRGDSDKRERARRGLDVAKQLQSLDAIEVELLQDGSTAREGVDERLLSHAKKSGGMLCTIDFNLNKVALVEGIKVLNINELARGLRMAYLPGDKISLELTTTGSDSHQAVGHLGDGTMVVVEHAKGSIGKTVDVEVIRSLQTAAGKMMFARLTNKSETGNKTSKTPQQPKTNKKLVTTELASVSNNAKKMQSKAKSAGRSSKQQKSPTSQSTSYQKAASKAARQTRKRTSAQRENSLINLVNQQSDD